MVYMGEKYMHLIIYNRYHLHDSVTAGRHNNFQLYNQ